MEYTIAEEQQRQIQCAAKASENESLKVGNKGKCSTKQARIKMRSSISVLESSTTRPKRITRDSTRIEDEFSTAKQKNKLPEKAVKKNVTENSKVRKFNGIQNTDKTAKLIDPTTPETTKIEETSDFSKLKECEKTTSVKLTEIRATRKSIKLESTQKPTYREIRERSKTITSAEPKKQTSKVIKPSELNKKLKRGNRKADTAKFKCSICSKTLTNKQSLVKHERIHNEDCKTLCTGPNKNLKMRSSEENSGEVIEKLQCDTVTSSNNSLQNSEETNLVNHAETVESTLMKPAKHFACDECSKIFNKQSRLVEHKRLHTGEKPFLCDVCGKQFRVRIRLYEHKQKKFKCEICQLLLCNKKDLNLHMSHHSNGRRYKCSVCPKAFVRSSDLKIHVRVHTDERPYTCDICHKCFRANQNLSVHRKFHMGDASKTFKCEHCDKKFMRKIDRKVHMRSHTGEKPYKCEICQRGYSSKVNLRCHVERDHLAANGVETPTKTKKKRLPPKKVNGKSPIDGHHTPANGVAKPSKIKKKSETKSRNLREELEKQKKLIEELQNQLYQQIKTEEKIISDEETEQEYTASQNSNLTISSANNTSTKSDPIKSAYELLSKLKASSTTSFKTGTGTPSLSPLTKSPSIPSIKAKSDANTLLPLTIAQTLEQASLAPSSSSPSTSSLTTPSPSKTRATKVVSQTTVLGIQQVSVTVSMQVENVSIAPNNPENEDGDILTITSTCTKSKKAEGSINVKKES